MTDVTLVAPFGADFGPISHGSIAYRPYLADPKNPQSKLLVDTPPHVAHCLTHNAGFYPMSAAQSEPTFAGTARLYAPYGCSWGGVQYHPDMDDIITVPSAAVADLLAFPPICPETLRPEREPLPAHVMQEHDAQIIARIKERLEGAQSGTADHAEILADMKAHPVLDAGAAQTEPPAIVSKLTPAAKATARRF